MTTMVTTSNRARVGPSKQAPAADGAAAGEDGRGKDMSAIPRERDNPTGLHARYKISHVNGEPIDPMATYFVLRLD